MLCDMELGLRITPCNYCLLVSCDYCKYYMSLPLDGIIVCWVIFQQRYTLNLDLKILILVWEQYLLLY